MNNNYSPEIIDFLNGRGVPFFSPFVMPKSFNNNFPHKEEILNLLSYYKDFKSSDEDITQTSIILSNYSLPIDMVKILTDFCSITSHQKAGILRLEQDCKNNKKDILKDLDKYRLPDNLKSHLLDLDKNKNSQEKMALTLG